VCGFNNNPFAPFQIDVSKAIKAGDNEVMVGIRDAWYGRTFSPKEPMKVRRQFNLPLSYFGQGFQNLDYPIWNNPNSGILEIPTFLSVGKVYASDVFVKPSVAKKQLGAEITVTNPTGAAASGEISGPRLTTKPARPPKHLCPSRLRLRQTAMQCSMSAMPGPMPNCGGPTRRICIASAPR
jgi:hypothetical protein